MAPDAWPSLTGRGGATLADSGLEIQTLCDGGSGRVITDRTLDGCCCCCHAALPSASPSEAPLAQDNHPPGRRADRRGVLEEEEEEEEAQGPRQGTYRPAADLIQMCSSGGVFILLRRRKRKEEDVDIPSALELQCIDFCPAMQFRRSRPCLRGKTRPESSVPV
ncbi:hypothetical protein B0T18DRAFT_393896 [Schizothecium vesticola]|uniref:Uncharacterized protein n=1 Tax=Schizothecium vesticola TaxID=314040 RepID=A0AA40EKX1_9PEZI|nr:hypothetical protein B0T18DRAFT_393896 [Schizothecium vesticola]